MLSDGGEISNNRDLSNGDLLSPIAVSCLVEIIYRMVGSYLKAVSYVMKNIYQIEGSYVRAVSCLMEVIYQMVGSYPCWQ